MTATRTLIRDLAEQAAQQGDWHLTSDEISERYDSVDAYRAMYETGLVSTDEYGPDNVGELLLLLDSLAGRDYRPEFRDAGLFLTHEDRLELTERFVRTVRRAIVIHVPEPETFRAMLAEFKRYDVASFTYLETFLPRAELAARCASEYMEDITARTEAATVLAATVRSYLLLLLQRHVVDIEDLAPALMEILRTVARHEGVLPRGRSHATADDGRRPEQEQEPDETRSALIVLGIRSARPDRGEIQRAYRDLMRRYHPDINPDGLERAKEINNAYAILIGGS